MTYGKKKSINNDCKEMVVRTIEKLNECYEYSSSVKLKGLESRYITIPSSIILNTEMDVKRIAIFSYLRIVKGLDDIVRFNVPTLVQWCGLQPNSHPNKINTKFINIINDFRDIGYLTYSNEISKTTYTEIKFNSNKVFDKCQTESFAIIYLDEIEKIMQYQKKDTDKYFNNTILLLVFTFFRNVIFNRPNKLKLEERNVDDLNNNDKDIDARKKRSPEAYADTYSNIGEQIGISARMVSKAVFILEQELGLIVTDETYRVRNDEGEFRTQYTLFANAYKREGEFLFADGETYSRAEIERKVEIIKKYNSKFIINEKKRKSVKGG